MPALALRISYAGELGWELYTPTEHGRYLWDQLFEAGADLGVVACGTGAFNSLRMEKGYRFAGVDMTREHTPFEAGLGFTVHFTKPRFNGREAALAARARGPAQAPALPRARRRRRHLLRRRAARCATAMPSAT